MRQQPLHLPTPLQPLLQPHTFAAHTLSHLLQRTSVATITHTCPVAASHICPPSTPLCLSQPPCIIYIYIKIMTLFCSGEGRYWGIQALCMCGSDEVPFAFFADDTVSVEALKVFWAAIRSVLTSSRACPQDFYDSSFLRLYISTITLRCFKRPHGLLLVQFILNLTKRSSTRIEPLSHHS